MTPATFTHSDSNFCQCDLAAGRRPQLDVRLLPLNNIPLKHPLSPPPPPPPPPSPRPRPPPSLPCRLPATGRRTHGRKILTVVVKVFVCRELSSGANPPQDLQSFGFRFHVRPLTVASFCVSRSMNIQGLVLGACVQ